MPKLWIILLGFNRYQTEEFSKELKQAAAEEFYDKLGVRIYTNEIETAYGKSNGSNSSNPNIIVAYSETPSIINVAKALKIFGESLSEIYERILPSECGFSGKISVYNKNMIKDFDRIFVNNEKKEEQASVEDDKTKEEQSVEFVSQKPRFTFEQLVLAPDVRQNIMESITILSHKDKLFNEWGLRAIMNPSVILNLYGDSGTGKTMAAEAISNYLNKNIIRATYADIESKYHGEGPKNLKALFEAAEREDAVLFIDEADSMLSSRLSNVSQGSEQAINSMRSQLLISLENFSGIVIFATNLIENYDKAFLTRLICIEMKRPDKEGRKHIWHNHLYPVGEEGPRLNIPLDDDVDIDSLSEYDFCGRDIRNTVKHACIVAVLEDAECVSQKHLLYACAQTQRELDELKQATSRSWEKSRELSDDEKSKVQTKLVKYIENKQQENNSAEAN